MEQNIQALTVEIEALPKGSIVKKMINGKEWSYLQGTEKGKSRS